MNEQNSGKITITQVAQLAGVSVGTVSNYLNGTKKVSDARSRSIQSAIDALEYTPDAIASSLRRKGSKSIYVLTPSLSNSFYTNIIYSLMIQADREGYIVNILGFEYSVQKERKQLRNLESSRPGTIVIVFNGFEDEEGISRLVEKGIGVIVADRRVPIKDVSSVVFENHEVFYKIFEWLKERGYKKIGLFMEPTKLVNIKKRYESFLEAGRNYGFEHAEQFVYTRPSLSLDKLKNGYLFMKEILDDNKKQDLPDAWIATSDYLAIGMMRAMLDEGYSVPGDFGVIGFDNIELSEYISPRLTTVGQDTRLCGETLWNIVERINNGSEETHVVLPQELIVRESC